MIAYRLCPLGPTGRVAAVRRYWASNDEGAVARAREILAEDPTLIGFELRDGSRKVAEGAQADRRYSTRSWPSTLVASISQRPRSPRAAALNGLEGRSVPPLRGLRGAGDPCERRRAFRTRDR